jgi:F420-dependent oxidoreductase-like protein
MIPIGLALAPPAPDVPDALADLLARAREAAAAGMASLWLGQVYDIDALTAWAAIGARVPSVLLGTAVVAVHSRHPIAMSSQAKTTQVAVGGRLCLGLGVGHRATAEDRYGISYDRPALRMREYLEALQPLLTRGEAGFHGRTVTADTRGWPADVPGAGPPPVLVAAMGPAMLRAAGELAGGTVTWLAGPRTIADHIRPALDKAAAGRPAPAVVASLPVCLTGDAEAARDRAAAALGFYAAVPAYRNVLDREGAASPADVALIGDERVLDQSLAGLVDAGVTHLVANMSGFVTEEERLRTLEYLASRSAPADGRL